MEWKIPWIWFSFMYQFSLLSPTLQLIFLWILILQVCSYFKDPLTCIGTVATDQVCTTLFYFLQFTIENVALIHFYIQLLCIWWIWSLLQFRYIFIDMFNDHFVHPHVAFRDHCTKWRHECTSHTALSSITGSTINGASTQQWSLNRICFERWMCSGTREIVCFFHPVHPRTSN